MKIQPLNRTVVTPISVGHRLRFGADACLEQDMQSRVACEVMVNSAGTWEVAVEISEKAKVDIEDLVYGVRPECKRVLLDLQQQSPVLAATVASGGANDQGVMVGFACDETPEFMPLPIILAHRITRRLAEVRKSGLLPYLRADGKAQVTVRYDNGVPQIDTVVVSTQHDEAVDLNTLRADIIEHIIETLPVTLQTTVLLNAKQEVRDADKGLLDVLSWIKSTQSAGW